MVILVVFTMVTSPVYAGASFTGLSAAISIIQIKNADELNKIVERFYAARMASQRAMSKEELDKLKEKAEEAKRNQSALLVDSGAMVYIGSYVVE